MGEYVAHTGADSPRLARLAQALGIRARLAAISPGVLAVLVTPGPVTLRAILADETPPPAVFVPCAAGAP